MAKKKRRRARPVWIATELMNNPALVAMDDHEWVTKFKAALHGEKNEFSPYVRFKRPELPDTIWGEGGEEN